MKLFRRCFALGVAVCLICRKSALPLGQLLIALPDTSFVAGAIVVCWGCPSLAMRDSSFVVERLRIPRGRKSEYAVVLPACSTCDPNIIGSICPEVPLDLGGDVRADVEWFVQLSLSPASWGVPIRRTTPSSKYEERVREKFSGRCEPVYRSLPVTGVSL
ncbi:hypothetical protein CDL15_Pgr009185 [Punica granatum]|uniref:Uncharacterized protein n=1 Tax=Punica granatum TaxID=22663 RepID=A0A218WW79_PUNGR|nr:hypothetical protein CDL15_Pgr009185 [Punica granatum]